MVSLRPATVDDIDQIRAIEEQSFPLPWPRESFQNELLIPYSRFYVLTDDDTDEVVTGYIVYRVQVEGVSLLNIAVHPSWKHLGFAKKLMQAMINEAVRDEIPKITLEVRASNSGALKLYTNLGFEKTHERKNFYSNGETAYIMTLKTSELSNTLH